MQFVITLARANVDNGSGGPFACAIVNESGDCI